MYYGDGQKIYIPSINDKEDISYITNDAGQNVVVSDNTSRTPIININSATQSDLEKLPGVGSSTAEKIIDYRTKNGKFKKIEDIMNISGIKTGVYNKIKDHITVQR